MWKIMWIFNVAHGKQIHNNDEKILQSIFVRFIGLLFHELLLNKMQKLSFPLAATLTFSCIALVVLSILAAWGTFTPNCIDLRDCESNRPICAINDHQNEHQFFYSHCDMIRENCMTGKSMFKLEKIPENYFLYITD